MGPEQLGRERVKFGKGGKSWGVTVKELGGGIVVAIGEGSIIEAQSSRSTDSSSEVGCDGGHGGRGGEGDLREGGEDGDQREGAQAAR